MELTIDVLVVLVGSIVIASNVWSILNLHPSHPSLIKILTYNAALLVCFAPCVVDNPTTYRNYLSYFTVPRPSLINIRVTVHDDSMTPKHTVITCIILVLAMEISALMIAGVFIDGMMEAFLVNMFIPIDPLTATVGYLALVLLLWSYTGILQYLYYKSWVNDTVLRKMKGDSI